MVVFVRRIFDSSIIVNVIPLTAAGLLLCIFRPQAIEPFRIFPVDVEQILAVFRRRNHRLIRTDHRKRQYTPLFILRQQRSGGVLNGSSVDSIIGVELGILVPAGGPLVAFMANIEAIEITGITEIGKTELLDVARTGDAARFSPRLAQSREQQGGKNRDDRDYDEEFDQGRWKRAAASAFVPSPPTADRVKAWIFISFFPFILPVFIIV